ncbi:MAG: prepilin-type N-terminal cleavage/methylation domain-containing protein [Planctomycetes bacterium]|nr:prepilin-type N-terminal cleavage/methylation domain-containing protein [Planctomycetota bacterium]
MRPGPRRRGMTLVELLIVISVSVLLLAVAVPLLRISVQGRKVREASRQLNALITRVKARAAELGRPVGLLLRRGDTAFATGSFYATQLFVAESPIPYAGDEATAFARIPAPTAPGIPVRMNPPPAATFTSPLYVEALHRPFTARVQGSALLPSIVSVGDMIQFDFKGIVYEILEIVVPDAANNPDIVDLWFRVPPRRALPVGVGAPPPMVDVGYQIQRSPVRLGTFSSTGQTTIRTGALPVNLPNGIVVDLSVSGMEPDFNQFTAADPADMNTWTPSGTPDDTDIVILFEPDGTVQCVYSSIYQPGSPPVLRLVRTEPTGTIFLLVGRIEQVLPGGDAFARGPEEFSNLMDADNLWVAIAHRTGKVTTAENNDLVAYAPSVGTPVPPLLMPGLLATARQFAISAQDIGGR